MKRSGIVVGDRILGLAADTHCDWCAGYGSLGTYAFVGASAIGKMHLRERRPRDDAFAIRTAGTWVAVAVADGVGSRPHSRYGASYAVEALCEQLLREVTGISPLLEPDENASEQQVSTEPKAASEISIVSKWEQLLEFTKKNFLRRPELTSRPTRRAQPETNLPRSLPIELPASEPLPPTDPTRGNSYGTLCWQCEWDMTAERSATVDEEISTNLSEESILHAFERTRIGLEQFAQSRGLSLSEVACTLQGLLLNTETGAVGAGHIGDGLIATLHPGLGAHPLVNPPSPVSVGETYVFTQKNWQEHLAVRYLAPHELVGVTTFYLMTDGVSDDCTYPPPEDIFQRWARDIDRELRKDERLSMAATRLLHWLANYEARGSWDDRTLVVILRKSDVKVS